MALVHIPVVLSIEVPDGTADYEEVGVRLAKKMLEGVEDERLVEARAHVTSLILARD